MAMKLLAHVLRGDGLDTEDEPAAAGPIESRRWVFRDLVVRRVGFAPWGLALAAPADGAPAERPEAAAEPLWADTQPWYTSSET